LLEVILINEALVELYSPFARQVKQKTSLFLEEPHDNTCDFFGIYAVGKLCKGEERNSWWGRKARITRPVHGVTERNLTKDYWKSCSQVILCILNFIYIMHLQQMYYFFGQCIIARGLKFENSDNKQEDRSSTWPINHF
jgi:hypothetical protein